MSNEKCTPAHRREYHAVIVITGSKLLVLTSISFRFYFTSSEHYCWTHSDSNYSGNNRRSSFGNSWKLLFDVVTQSMVPILESVNAAVILDVRSSNITCSHNCHHTACRELHLIHNTTSSSHHSQFPQPTCF